MPIKLFILNNNGYSSIKQTQNNFFEGRQTASGKESGVSFPDFIKVAQAFDLPAVRISNQDNLKDAIDSDNNDTTDGFYFTNNTGIGEDPSISPLITVPVAAPLTLRYGIVSHEIPFSDR